MWLKNRQFISMLKVEIDVWTWAIDGTDLEASSALLSASEQERLARLTHRQRLSYAATHSKKRVILATYGGIHPSALVFFIHKSGKPALMEGPHFNLSHSDGLAVMAVSRHCEVGIDIERVRPLADRFADRFFSPAEAHALAAVPEGEREMARIRLWTRKEALLKATGQGLRRDTRTFSVDLTRTCAGVVTGFEDCDRECAAWFVADIPPAEDYAGSLAVKAGTAQVSITRREA
jgi:4'-phosphopantetheinyl transferase